MNYKMRVTLTIVFILSICIGLPVLSVAGVAPGTNADAERHYEVAYELRRAADYDGAITEYEQVVRLSPKSKMAQDAQYWIGQSHFESKRFDVALSVFQGLFDNYPSSSIAPSAKQMIDRVQQAQKNRALFEAVNRADVKQIRNLIAEGADVDARWGDITTKADEKNLENTPLFYAVDSNNMDSVKLLVEAGADVNTGKWPPLCQAVDENNTAIAEYLIDHGANVNHPKWGPLQQVPYVKNSSKMAELLIANGADVNVEGLSNPLYNAVWNHAYEIARLLVTHGADLNYKLSWEPPPFYSILSENDKELVELMVEKGSRAPAFHLAAFRGDLVEVKRIHTEGADINERDELNWTPLHWAASGCQSDIAEFLINNGADVSVAGTFGKTPLHPAASSGAKELATLLLSKGANVNAESEPGKNTPLHSASGMGRQDLVELLVANGASIDVKNRGGRTPLFQAITNGHKETVEFLIARGANINTYDNSRRTALIRAKECGHSDIAALLRQHGAQETLAGAVTMEIKHRVSEGYDVNSLDSEGRTPLYVAVRRGQKEMAVALIDNGADVNLRTSEGQLPLHLAAGRGKMEMAEVLIAHGADVDAKDDSNQTALHKMLDIRNVTNIGYPLSKDMLELLLAKGADVNLKDKNGRAPLHLAAELAAGEIVALLLENGAEINAKDNKGFTALHHAARFGNKEVAEVLVARNADINAKNNHGHTPLYIAANHTYRLAEFLMDNGADSEIRIKSDRSLFQLVQQRKQIESPPPDMIFNGSPNGPLGNTFICGDVDGDGYDDILVGHGYYDNERGRVCLFYGGPDMDLTADLILEGQHQGDRFGSSVKSGDIDNDGYGDIVINAYGHRNGTGRAYLYWGSERHTMDTIPDIVFVGEQEPGAQFSRGPTVYDINNDGHDDIILQTHARDSKAQAYLYYGNTKELMDASHDLIFTGGRFIYGDVDNDGYGDRIFRREGRAYLHFGNSQSTMDAEADHIFEIEGTRYGGQVCVDLNGDGCDDVVVSDTQYNSKQGRACLFYGNPKRRLNADPDIVFEGEVERSLYGHIACGDLDGDQINDLIISADYYRQGLGRVYVYWGNELSDHDPKPGRIFTGENPRDDFGRSLACGDINNDGIDDLIVGTSRRNTGTRRVYLYYGGPRKK